MGPKEIGKRSAPVGKTPAVILENPKHAHNVAKVLRICSCFDIQQLWWTGDRVNLADYEGKGKRLPREERMKGYKWVEMLHYDRPFEQFREGGTVIGFDLIQGSIALDQMPMVIVDDPVFVFGPEDGAISKVTRGFCHYLVHIPVRHCLNLATAVSIAVWHWHVNRLIAGEREPLELSEERGFITGEESLFVS